MYWCHINDLFLLSDLADLVEIIHKIVQLMENLQERGTLRVCDAFFVLLWVKFRWKAFFVLAFILLGFILLGLIVCVTEKVNGANWADGFTTFFLGRWSHY